MDMIGPAEFILYVADQAASRVFWSAVLGQSPSLDVPGMTEFTLTHGAVLGLMPEAGISALLGPALPDPALGRGVPRCELYLVVDDPAGHHERALAAGARELSPLSQRAWGDETAYCLDRDGHVIAFAGSRSPVAGSDTQVGTPARISYPTSQQAARFATPAGRPAHAN